MKGEAHEKLETAALLARRLKTLEPDAVLHVGEVHRVIQQSWFSLVTVRVVITGERYRHFIARHAEMIGAERQIIEAIHQPDAIHLNERDPNIVVLYRTGASGATIRLALWISDDPGRSNSIHSARFAHAREKERGTQRGRVITEKS